MRGWSLIECMLVVSLCAVLAAMALPLQTAWGQRAQRAQARAALAQASWWMERQAALTGTYPTSMPDAAWAQEGLSYTLSLTQSGNGYVLRAWPVGRQSADACGTLWLNDQGMRGTEGGSGNCW